MHVPPPRKESDAMSYLLPLNSADIGLDRFEPMRFDGVQAGDDDDGCEQAEGEPFEGGLKSGRGETRSAIDEMREFRRAKPEDCDRDWRGDRDGDDDRDGRHGRGIGLEREPRRPL
jgi:hypothetical protein